MRRALAVLLLFTFSVSGNAEDNWPRFRGSDGAGAAPDHSKLPLSWTNQENVAWVADVPGWGWSCPIVWEDRVYLTTVVSEQQNLTPSKGLYLGEGVRTPAKGTHHWVVYCFDLKSGKTVWKHTAHTGEPRVPRHPKSTYAAETAVTDGERVYVLFGDVGLYCYDMDGNPEWSVSIEARKTFQDYGAAASPVVHGDQVFVVYDNLEESWIAAYDTKTGQENWKQPRNETHTWATPMVWQNRQRTEIVVPGRKLNRSYSLDGKVLWSFDGKMSNLVIPSPFTAHGMCYIASGYIGDSHRPTFAIRPGATGDISPEDGDYASSEYIEWYQGRSSPYNPSQIVYGDYLYTLYDRGFLTCHDARTGEEVYGKRRFTPTASFTSSPFAYNGHLFFLSEDGLTYVVKAGPEFEIVGRNKLGELCMSCPAISGERLLIRTAGRLYCMTEGASLSEGRLAELEAGRKAENYTDFWSAARTGNVKEVARLLKSGMDVNARQGRRGATALATASMHGQLPVAELLLKNGADVKLANPDGNTPLLLASFFGRAEVVDLLLDHGANPTTKNRRGESPIDVVSADWSDELAGTYRGLQNAIGAKLDLEQIRKVRPVILAKLKDKAE